MAQDNVQWLGCCFSTFLKAYLVEKGSIRAPVNSKDMLAVA
jgi:hypothetical protein